MSRTMTPKQHKEYLAMLSDPNAQRWLHTIKYAEGVLKKITPMVLLLQVNSLITLNLTPVLSIDLKMAMPQQLMVLINGCLIPGMRSLVRMYP